MMIVFSIISTIITTRDLKNTPTTTLEKSRQPRTQRKMDRVKSADYRATMSSVASILQITAYLRKIRNLFIDNTYPQISSLSVRLFKCGAKSTNIPHSRFPLCAYVNFYTFRDMFVPSSRLFPIRSCIAVVIYIVEKCSILFRRHYSNRWQDKTAIYFIRPGEMRVARCN